jgi:hypothetical protein
VACADASTLSFNLSLGVLRYRSAIDSAVQGLEAGPLECWHLDCYRRDEDGQWRVRWSQATSIGTAQPGIPG